MRRTSKRTSGRALTGAIAAAVAATLGAGHQVYGQNAATWTTGNGTWSTQNVASGGWSGPLPDGVGDSATWDDTAKSSITTTQDLAGTRTVGKIEILGNANASWQITLASGKNLTLNQDGGGSGTAVISNATTGVLANPSILMNGGAGIITLNDDLLITNTSQSTRAGGSIEIDPQFQGNGNITFYSVSNTIGSGHIALFRTAAGGSNFGGNSTIAKGAVTYNRGDRFTPTPGDVITIGSAGNGDATLGYVGTSIGAQENNMVSAANTGGTNRFVYGGTSTGSFTFRSTNSFAASVRLDGDLTFDNRNTADANNSVFVVGDPITGIGKATFTGAGPKEVTNGNSYYGGTVLNQSSLKVHHVDPTSNQFGAYVATDGTLGSGDVTIATGATHLEITPANWPSAANPINVIGDAAAVSIADGTLLMLDSGTTAAADGSQPITVNETIGGLVLGGVTQTQAGTYGSSASAATHVDDAHFSGPGMVTLVLGRTLYWDVNNITAGAGGDTPTGTWGAASGTTFNTDATGGGGGTITAQSLSTDPVVFTAASDGNGAYTVTVNGTQNAASVSVPRGTVTFAAGTSPAINTPTFNVDSGASANVSVPVNPGSAGGLTKTGTGTLTLGTANTYTGGTTVSGGTLVLADADATGGGAINVANSAVARAQASLPKAVTVSTLATNTSGKFDLTNNSMVVRNMTVAQVGALVKTGFAGGAWTGTGINSSTAAASTITAVGFADNSILNKTLFKGVNVGPTDVLVKYTYYGDADLSGATTLDDFTLFLNGYQTGGTTWVQGDFDYSGTVTLDDFTLFLGGYQNQGAPLSALEAMINSVPMSSAERQAMLAAVEAVPEPTGLALLGLAGAGLLARRRRTA